MRLDTSNFPSAGIACANIGGTDVIGSAERAPLRPAPFDRLAVGEITAANSSGSVASGQAALSGECPEAPPVDGAHKGPSGTAATACKSGGGALPLITGDKDRDLPVGGPTDSHHCAGAYCEVGFPASMAAPVLMQEPHVEAEGQGRVMQEHGREEGSQSRLPSDPVENKADGPSVIAAVFSSPDPRTSEGADGHLGIPSPNVAGAKSDSADPLSSVGPAQGLDHGYRQLGQVVSYSPWTVRRSSNSLRSTYP